MPEGVRVAGELLISWVISKRRGHRVSSPNELGNSRHVAEPIVGKLGGSTQCIRHGQQLIVGIALESSYLLLRKPIRSELLSQIAARIERVLPHNAARIGRC